MWKNPLPPKKSRFKLKPIYKDRTFGGVHDVFNARYASLCRSVGRRYTVITPLVREATIKEGILHRFVNKLVSDWNNVTPSTTSKSHKP